MADPEVVVSDKGGVYSPQIFAVDDVEPVESEVSVEEPETEPELEIEGKKSVETEVDPTAELKKEIGELKNELLKLSSRREPPPQQVEPPKGEEKLTRQQIVGILKEHKDDPEVLANVIDYISEQKAATLRDETLKDVNYRQWSSNLSGISNKILHDDEDGYLAANPKVVSELDNYAGNLGLKDHPVGRLAAYAIMRLGEQVQAKTKAKESEKPSKEEVKPSTRVMDKTRTFDTQGKSKGLTTEQMAVAKKFGVKPETYAKFIRRS